MIRRTLVNRHPPQRPVSQFGGQFKIHRTIEGVPHAKLDAGCPAVDLPPVLATGATDILVFGADLVGIPKDDIVGMGQQNAGTNPADQLQVARLVFGAVQMVQPNGIDHDVVQAIVQVVIEIIWTQDHRAIEGRGPGRYLPGHSHRLIGIGVVFAVVERKLNRKCLFGIEIATDPDVFLGICELKARERPQNLLKITREVAPRHLAQREIIAQSGLRHMDVGRRILLPAVAPGKIPIPAPIGNLVLCRALDAG